VSILYKSASCIPSVELLNYFWLKLPNSWVIWCASKLLKFLLCLILPFNKSHKDHTWEDISHGIKSGTNVCHYQKGKSWGMGGLKRRIYQYLEILPPLHLAVRQDHVNGSAHGLWAEMTCVPSQPTVSVARAGNECRELVRLITGHQMAVHPKSYLSTLHEPSTVQRLWY
jgi:hypothetical protein